MGIKIGRSLAENVAQFSKVNRLTRQKKILVSDCFTRASSYDMMASEFAAVVSI